MAFSYPSYRNTSRCSIYVLIFFWTFGLSFGMYFASMAEPDIASWMCALSYSGVSILGLLIVTLLPFFLSLFAVRFHQPWIIILLAFVKSFIFGYWRSFNILLFNNVGWLINFLLFFSDTCIVILLLIYWIVIFCQRRPSTMPLFWFIIITSCFLCMFDWWFISPILTAVLA